MYMAHMGHVRGEVRQHCGLARLSTKDPAKVARPFQKSSIGISMLMLRLGRVLCVH